MSRQLVYFPTLEQRDAEKSVFFAGMLQKVDPGFYTRANNAERATQVLWGDPKARAFNKADSLYDKVTKVFVSVTEDNIESGNIFDERTSSGRFLRIFRSSAKIISVEDKDFYTAYHDSVMHISRISGNIQETRSSMPFRGQLEDAFHAYREASWNRDQHIAGVIGEKLGITNHYLDPATRDNVDPNVCKTSETGLLLLGLYHDIRGHLPKDITFRLPSHVKGSHEDEHMLKGVDSFTKEIHRDEVWTRDWEIRHSPRERR